ncbi:MAG TPA: hypothetical protein VMJ74_09640 [Pseudomonadales bacterium]|nr:hypothetical protein [Pseudomonadales bacterium]
MNDANAKNRSAQGYRLNLGAIETSLRDLSGDFASVNSHLTEPRDPLDEQIVDNMLLGYRLVDTFVAADADLFADDPVGLMLQLNDVVLCGDDAERRRQRDKYHAAAEHRFYDERDGGIADILEWYEDHSGESPWKRAAGVFVRILSQPQLFLEGNHRTGALIMSYILLRAGLPPFVLTLDNALEYFNPSAVVRKTLKKNPTALFKLPKIKARYAEFLKANADRRYLLEPQLESPRGRAES